MGAYTGRPRDRGSHWNSSIASTGSGNEKPNNIRRVMASRRQGSRSPSSGSTMRRGSEGGATARAQARAGRYGGGQGYSGYQGNSPMGMAPPQDGELRARVNSLEQASERQQRDIGEMRAREDAVRREASEARAREESWKRQYTEFENRISQDVIDLNARAADATSAQANTQQRMSRLEQSTERVEENLSDVMERDQAASRQVAEWRSREEQLTRRLAALEGAIGVEPMEGPGRPPSPGRGYVVPGRDPRGRGRSPGRGYSAPPFPGPAGDWREGPAAPWDEDPPGVAPMGAGRPRRPRGYGAGAGRAMRANSAEARAQARWESRGEQMRGPAGPGGGPWEDWQDQYPAGAGPRGPGAEPWREERPGNWGPGPEGGRPMSAVGAKEPSEAAWAGNREQPARSMPWSP